MSGFQLPTNVKLTPIEWKHSDFKISTPWRAIIDPENNRVWIHDSVGMTLLKADYVHKVVVEEIVHCVNAIHAMEK